VKNITFFFETSPNAKPKEKKVEGHGILCPPCLKKWGWHVPRVPHQIARMLVPPVWRLVTFPKTKRFQRFPLTEIMVMFFNIFVKLV